MARGDDVARREVGQRVAPCMNRTPSRSTRKAPSPRTASEMSGCWPLEPSPSQSTVGWNWTNSTSASPRPGAQRRRHAVTGGDGRVGRRGVDLAEAAGGEHDGAGVRGADAVHLALADDVERDAADPAASSSWSRSTTRACSTTSMPGSSWTRCSAAMSAREISLPVASPPGVGDAVAVVPALAGQLELALGVEVELGPRATSSRTRRPLVDEGGHGLDVADPDAGDERVVQVLLR